MSNKKILNQVVSSTLSVFIALVVAFFVSTKNINAYLGSSMGDIPGITYTLMVGNHLSSGINWTIHTTSGNVSYYKWTGSNSNTNIVFPAYTDYVIMRFDFQQTTTENQDTNTFDVQFLNNNWFPTNLINVQYAFNYDNSTVWRNELFHSVDAYMNKIRIIIQGDMTQGNYIYLKLIFDPSPSTIYIGTGLLSVAYYMKWTSNDGFNSIMLNSVASKLSYLGGSTVISDSDYTTILNSINDNLASISEDTDVCSRYINVISVNINNVLDKLTFLMTNTNSIITDLNGIISRMATILDNLTNIDTNLHTIIDNEQVMLNNLTTLINNGNLTNDKLTEVINQLKDISSNIGDISININGGDVTINDITNNYNSIVNNYNTVNNYLSEKVTNLTTINNDLDNGVYNLSDQLINSIALPVNFINGLYTGNSGIQILLWLPLLLSLVLLIIGRGRKG